MGRAVRKVSEVGVCILAGGASRRFGSNKAFAELHSKPLLAHVIDRIRPQTSGPIIINSNDLECYQGFGLKVIADDDWSGTGPLAGVYAAISWARHSGLDQVVTVAVDQPFLPHSYIATLLQTGAPAIATSLGRLHPVNALWSPHHLSALDGYLRSGNRSVLGWAEKTEARIVEFPESSEMVDPFLNVNTTDDLSIAKLTSRPNRP